MNDINKYYKNFQTSLNALIDFNKKNINRILHFLKFRTFTLINNYKKYRHYNV